MLKTTPVRAKKLLDYPKTPDRWVSVGELPMSVVDEIKRKGLEIAWVRKHENPRTALHWPFDTLQGPAMPQNVADDRFTVVDFDDYPCWS